MKTKLLLALTVIVLALGLGWRTNTLFVTASNTLVSTNFDDEEIEPDDSTLSLEYLKDANWDDLRIITVVTPEDDICSRLVRVIFKPSGIGSIQNIPYIKVDLGIDYNDVDSSRVASKLNEIIRIYNEGNPYNLTLETTPTQYPRHIILSIRSTNLKELENPITSLGQIATLKAGSLYWSSSDQYGSDNCFTTKTDLSVTVNGVSYLSEDGSIISSIYIPFTDFESDNTLVEVQFSEIRLLHICIDEKDYGWVHPNDLITH